MDIDVLLPKGSKYALVTIPTEQLCATVPADLTIAPGVTAHRTCPIPVPSHWKEWLGTLRTGVLQGRGLTLLTVAPSLAPEVLDSENLKLTSKIDHLYWGLVLAVPNIAHDHAQRLSGAHHPGQRDIPIDIREIQPYDAVRDVAWSPTALIKPVDLATAAEIAECAARLHHEVAFRRVWRMLHAFARLVRSQDLGERVQQAVQCIEGLLLPRKGTSRADFLKRTQLLTNATPEVLGQIYDIRSAAVHMHDPHRYLPAIPAREQRILLIRRAIESEALARHVLRWAITRNPIRRFLQDDQALEQFWLLPIESQEQIWGSTFDIGTATTGLRADLIDDESLGLR